MRKKQILSLCKRVLLLLLLTVTVNSCKKDLVVAPKKISKTSKEIGTVENIAYSIFLKSVDLEKTGPLKAVFLAKPNTETSTKTNSATGEFELDMVNVKKLTLNNGVSYVIGVKPQTKRAIQFQNVTIQEKNGKTTAFLTTYIPTKKWIEEWKKGIQTDSLFRGEIYSQSINLSNLPNPNITLSTQSTNTTSKTAAITINGKLLNLAPGECEFYDIYQTIYIPCKEGHVTRAECNFFTTYGTWDEQPNDWPPYTHLVYAGNVVYCEPTSSGGGGSGGGSGSTTPNPPGDYDPCDCNTPPPNGNQSVKTNSTENKLLVIPANCCDGETTPPPYQFTLEDIEILKQIKAEDAIDDQITILDPQCYGTGRTGNVRWPGNAEHWLIQFDYVNTNPSALREYSIPNAGSSGTSRGYADLVNTYTGEIFEIKPNNPAGEIAAVAEVTNYVSKAQQSCKTLSGAPFSKGTLFPTRFYKHPLVANKILKAELTQAGVIVYSMINTEDAPQPIPVLLPQSLANRLRDFVRDLMQNQADMEKKALAFLRINPQLVPYLKAAAAGIVIGTIIEDILTGGAGIADDWASFVAARTIYRLALKIP